MRRAIDLAVFLASLTAIGAGVAMKDPAWSLVVVGGIVLTTVFVSRLLARLGRENE